MLQVAGRPERSCNFECRLYSRYSPLLPYLFLLKLFYCTVNMTVKNLWISFTPSTSWARSKMGFYAPLLTHIDVTISWVKISSILFSNVLALTRKISLACVNLVRKIVLGIKLFIFQCNNGLPYFSWKQTYLRTILPIALRHIIFRNEINVSSIRWGQMFLQWIKI